MFVPLCTLQRLLQIGDKSQPIRQAGQGIVMGQMSQAFLRLFDQPNIGEDSYIVRNTSVLVLYRCDILPSRINLAAFPSIPDLTMPLAFAFKCSPKLVIECFIVAARLLNARILT